MSQQINIDPEVWARTRAKAFRDGVTASRLVEDALRIALDPIHQFTLEVSAEQPSPIRAESPLAYEVVDGKPELRGNILDLVDETEFPVASDDEFDRHPRTAILEDQPPVPGGTTAIRDGQYVREERAPGPPRIITSPEEAAVAVKVDPVRAVPKPSARKAKR